MTAEAPFDLQDTVTIRGNIEMPWMGFGTYKIKDGSEVVDSVKWAIEAGYRSIDTAALYQNEEGVGKALKDSSISRGDIFLTSKVWNSDQGFDQTIKAFNTSLEKLGTDYLDLYLIHWPVVGKYKETWHAMENLHKEGKIRAIGVSNFLVHHLQDLMSYASVVPAVNQVEFHPYLQQPELQVFCRKNEIRLEAWSPIMKGKVSNIKELIEIGKKYGKTPAQVTLRWEQQKGIVVIPKSVHRERILENADIFDFNLVEEEIKKIDSLDKHERLGPDPDHVDF
ncbi:MAG TPA: aldo/keto reductase [Balneolales bacterium]|nr:aldo/keto reductase [Balneolales bacterium]